VTDQPDLMTIEEAAEYLRVNPQTVYRLMQRKALPGVKVGHQWRIRRADLDTYVTSDVTPQAYVPRNHSPYVED
jgi:excisionase family DNA binding protein